MKRTVLAILFIILTLVLYWLGIDNISLHDRIFFIAGLFPTIILISMILVLKERVDKREGRWSKILTALSGLPDQVFALRTFLPLSLVVIYLGIRLILFTQLGQSKCWNTFVALVFWMWITLTILSYTTKIGIKKKKRAVYSRIIMMLMSIIIGISAASVVITIVAVTAVALSIESFLNLRPLDGGFLNSRIFVPLDIFLLTIFVMFLKPKEK